MRDGSWPIQGQAVPAIPVSQNFKLVQEAAKRCVDGDMCVGALKSFDCRLDLRVWVTFLSQISSLIWVSPFS